MTKLPDKTPGETRKNRLFSILAAVLILCFTLCLLEATVRVYIYIRQSPPIFRYDSIYGWSLIPHKKIRFNFGDGIINLYLNKYGHNDVEWDVAKAPETLRIAFIGDSFTAGLHVDNKSTFASLTGKKLRETGTGSARVETMNFGVPGYSIEQEYILYNRLARKFKPDIVVLCVFTENDVFDMYHPYNRSTSAFKPYFTRAKNGALELAGVPPPRNYSMFPPEYPSGFREKWAAFIRNHFKTYQFTLVKLKTAFPRLFSDPADDIKFLSNGEIKDAFLASETPEWKRAYDIYFDAVRELERKCRRDNAKLVVVIIPAKCQVSGKQWNDVIREAAKAGKKYSRDAVEQRMTRAFTAMDVPTLTLLTPFLAGIRNKNFTADELYLKKDRHFSALGHKEAARLITDFIEGDLETGGLPMHPAERRSTH